MRMEINYNSIYILLQLFTLAISSEIAPNLFGVPGEGYILETLIGTPYQKLNVVVDTGSANFAVAANSNLDMDAFFNFKNSTSFIDYGHSVTVLYTQGSWSGEIASDLVIFPALSNVPKVRCQIGFISESNDFFVNGSNWQGILGLAYSSISRPNPNILTWLDCLQTTNKHQLKVFSLKLCGTRNESIDEHYGYFEILEKPINNGNLMISTPIVMEWFYEIVLTGLKVNGHSIPIDCKSFNSEKTIIDSGTTNLRFPQNIFDIIVREISLSSKIRIEDDFWIEGKFRCWNENMDWDELMPVIGIEIMHSTNQVFRLELPGSSYMRQFKNEHGFCYEFGIEPSSTGSILGVVALEGFQVTFNRAAKNVIFQKSDCGPNVQLAGPYSVDYDVMEVCWRDLDENMSMLQIAYYIVSVILIVAAILLSYLLVQWIKDKYFLWSTGLSTVAFVNYIFNNNRSTDD